MKDSSSPTLPAAPVTPSGEQSMPLASLMEGLGGGVNFCDAHERIIYANCRFANMMGYRPEEMIGKTTYDLIIPEEKQEFIRTQVAQRFQGVSSEYEVEFRRKDGSRFWAQVSACPFTSPSGDIIGSVAVIFDVTERRRSIDALRQSEQKYRDLVETSSDFIWSVDCEGRWTFVNQAVRNIYGYEPDQMIGRKFSEFLRPDLVAAALAEFEEILKGKRCFKYETVHVRKDGRPVHLSFNAIALLDASGAVVGATGTATDTTEIRDAEEAFRSIVEATASTTAQSFFDSLPCHLAKALHVPYAFLGRLVEGDSARVETLGVWWQNAAHANFSYTLAGSPSELVIRNGFTYFPDSVSERFPHDSHLANVGARGYMGAPIIDSSGRARGILAVLDDKPMRDWRPARSILTIFAARAGAEFERLDVEREAMQLQRHLSQSQKMDAIGQLAAGVAHDLNNALSAIEGHLQLMSLHKGMPAPLRESLATALAGCERAGSLIGQLLGFSRKGKYQVTAVPLARAVRDMLDFLGRVIPKNITIENRLADESVTVLADEGQLQQVLVNLTINASQAMPMGGVLTFLASRKFVADPQCFNSRSKPGDFVVLSVADTGVGIPPEHIDKIFEPFFTTKSAADGVGLGLSMVYGIVLNHGGWITVDSVVGQGTTFTLHLPAGITSQPVEAAPSPALLRRGDGCAMVIDDEIVLVELSRTFLERSGIQCHGFHDAGSALQWFKTHHDEVDVVILDMKMPGIDGEECFQRLRAIDPDVAVVLLSGYMDDSAVRKLLAEGAVKFFAKPLKYPDLTGWILDFLGSSRESARMRR